MGRDLFPNESVQPSKTTIKRKGRDLFANDIKAEEEPEGLGMAVLKAPFRIGGDIASSAWQGIQKIPEMYQQGDEQVQGLSDLINRQGVYANPEARKHAGMQSLAGLNELINNLAQMPRSLANYGENRLNLLPKGTEQFVGKHLVPEDTTEDINKLFGKPVNPGEALIRGVGRNALNLAGLGQVPGIIRNLPHLTKKGASKKLGEARQLGAERNMGPLNVNNELIEDARQFLPNTKPYRDLIEAAHFGDYNSLFRLQSDLAKHASKQAKSWFSFAERAHGKAGLESRRELMKDIHNNLRKEGHEDISDLLKEGQNDYRKYIKFKPYRNTLAIAALGAALPKNHLMNVAGKLLSNYKQ